jgi:hypothetical protein
MPRGERRQAGAMPQFDHATRQHGGNGEMSARPAHQAPAGAAPTTGAVWRFSLKGSPRHYDDVRRIIEDSGNAEVYFGEALTYERGAGVALWRVRARDFDWLPRLYEWWVEQERIEPVQFTFHLYIPPELKYPALDLREHLPADVAAYIRARAPKE